MATVTFELEVLDIEGNTLTNWNLTTFGTTPREAKAIVESLRAGRVRAAAYIEEKVYIEDGS